MYSPNAKGTRKKLSSRGILILLAAGAVAIVAGVVAWDRHAESQRLEETLAELKAKGYETTLEALNDSYERPPDEENAALVYLAAFDAFTEPAALSGLSAWDPEFRPDPWIPLSQSELSALDRFPPNDETLEILLRGVALDRSRYPIEFAMGYDMSLAHLDALARLARFLLVTAIYRAEIGDVEEALDLIEILFTLGDSLRNEPLLISQHTRLNIVGTGIEASIHALTRIPSTEEFLTGLADVVLGVHIDGASYIGLRGEITLVAEGVDSMMLGDPMGIDVINVPLIGGSPQWSFTDHVIDIADRVYMLFSGGSYSPDVPFLLDETAKLAEAARLPYPEALAVSTALNAQVFGLDDYRNLSGLILSQLAMGIEQETYVSAELKSLEAAIAVARYRLAEGSLPMALEDVSPRFIDATPIDPFDGQPLRYSKTDRGYIVYSIGENEIDDGGVKGSGFYGGDIVTEVRH